MCSVSATLLFQTAPEKAVVWTNSSVVWLWPKLSHLCVLGSLGPARYEASCLLSLSGATFARIAKPDHLRVSQVIGGGPGATSTQCGEVFFLDPIRSREKKWL